MAICVNCGAETRLYHDGRPICLACDDQNEKQISHDDRAYGQESHGHESSREPKNEMNTPEPVAGLVPPATRHASR